ncbi:radical SAM protein [Barnesiella propionica]|uniref:radical SAM protein n=1 Tax=Barnesiella propionica TaxID=2981781 RepID=UPI0011C8068C|nr:radical SAM protein [Barnesiella propionica]MCU6768877.1 radical SAM protein [Barnesiella propionica]
MSTILFNEIVFGPVHSRRLGVSLGINLLPRNGKLCSFDCLYCECGYNSQGKGTTGLPERKEVYEALEDRLKKMKEKNEIPDVITFAGNGEPTLHPQFGEIIDDTIKLRNIYFPQAKVSVLSNATYINSPAVVEALNKVDNNILKLDSAFDDTVRILNVPNNPDFSVEKLIGQLNLFQGNLVIQTMFLRGEHKGQIIDNTTEKEIRAWLEALKRIKPRQVMIYTIDRETPEKELRKVTKEELNSIAEKVKKIGFDVSVSA